MKKTIIPFLIAAVFSAPLSAQKNTAKPVATLASASQISAQAVIDNYIKALGGKQKLESVNTLYMENSISVQGMDITSTTKKAGNKFKSVQSVMGQEMVQIFDGEKGYFEQMGNKNDIPADKIADLKKGKTMDALGYDPSNFKTASVENIEGKSYNIISSDKGKFYFDATTGLLYKSETKEGNALIKSYMTVDGIKFPQEMDVEGNGQQISIKTTKVMINSGVSDADFKIN